MYALLNVSSGLLSKRDKVRTGLCGTAESRFHTPLTTTLGRGESNARCSASAGASASQAVGTPEMVTPETLKLMALLVEDGLVDVTE